MAELKLPAQTRTHFGRKVRQLRQKGLVPVVVYGKTMEAAHLQVTQRNLERVLAHGGASQLFEVVIEGGETTNVLLREIQRHPVNHRFMHADLYAVDMTEKQEVSIQLVAIGEEPEFEIGLMMLQSMDSVLISALPADIPAAIEVDITALSAENSITVADLPALPGVEYVDPADEVVFTVVATREEDLDEEIADEDVEPEVVGEEGDEEGDADARSDDSDED
ncbi:MAG: 50S ribosomal protein L25 [Litorilinea sp.]